jgi:hypothetical protein
MNGEVDDKRKSRKALVEEIKSFYENKRKESSTMNIMKSLSS